MTWSDPIGAKRIEKAAGRYVRRQRRVRQKQRERSELARQKQRNAERTERRIREMEESLSPAPRDAAPLRTTWTRGTLTLP